MSIENAKLQSCIAAVKAHVTFSTKIIGLGSGSTIKYIPQLLREMIDNNEIQLIAIVPTSFQSKQLILEHKLPLADLNQCPVINVTFDGADEVDDNLNLIKGGGACQLQEKLVACSSQTLVIVADESKDSQFLGQKWKKGVPLEVIPSGYVYVMRKLIEMGGKPILRMGANKAGPVISDNGNFIIDCDFGILKDPCSISDQLDNIVGLVEHGLFCNMATQIFFGKSDGSGYQRSK